MNEILKDEKINNIDMKKFNLGDYDESEINPYYKGVKKEDWKGENSDDDNQKVNCNNQ